jgi:hypothetical protein
MSGPRGQKTHTLVFAGNQDAGGIFFFLFLFSQTPASNSRMRRGGEGGGGGGGGSFTKNRKKPKTKQGSIIAIDEMKQQAYKS